MSSNIPGEIDMERMLRPLEVQVVGEGLQSEYHPKTHDLFRSIWERPNGGGQLKLWFSDMLAILAFKAKMGQFPQYIIVVGAAPGTHFRELVMLFPSWIEWHLYDPEKTDSAFSMKDHINEYNISKLFHNVHVHEDKYNKEAGEKWGGYRSALFLCDIRSLDHSKTIKTIEHMERNLQYLKGAEEIQEMKTQIKKTQLQIEKMVIEDLNLSIEMLNYGKGMLFGMLKCRLPWPIEIQRFKLLKGHLCWQISNLPSSTEGRLVVVATNAKKEYDFLQNFEFDFSKSDKYIQMSDNFIHKAVTNETHLLQTAPDPERKKAIYEEETKDLLEIESLFAHINTYKRPLLDFQKAEYIIKLYQDAMKIPIQIAALTTSHSADAQTGKKHLELNQDYWVSTGVTTDLSTWKLSVPQTKLSELSERDGCKTNPWQVEITALKQLVKNDEDRNGSQMEMIPQPKAIILVCSVFKDFWPIEHTRNNFVMVIMKNMICLFDRQKCFYYYIDFNLDYEWSGNLYVVKAHYQSCDPLRPDLRFFNNVGPDSSTSLTPDAGATTQVAYLLQTLSSVLSSTEEAADKEVAFRDLSYLTKTPWSRTHRTPLWRPSTLSSRELSAK